MIDFLRKLFGAAPPSSATAKERLRLVLMTDHLALAPEIIEQMKHDLVDVISRYVEVDRERIEVNFEQQDKALAMLANIPILSVNRPTPGGGTNGRRDPVATASPASDAAAPEGPGAPPRRRRRRRKAAQAALAPNG